MSGSALTCTNARCNSEADRVIAIGIAVVPSVFVAPYCAHHGDAIIAEGRGTFAAGPALSDECSKIQGVRR